MTPCHHPRAQEQPVASVRFRYPMRYPGVPDEDDFGVKRRVTNTPRFLKPLCRYLQSDTDRRSPRKQRLYCNINTTFVEQLAFQWREKQATARKTDAGSNAQPVSFETCRRRPKRQNHAQRGYSPPSRPSPSLPCPACSPSQTLNYSPTRTPSTPRVPSFPPLLVLALSHPSLVPPAEQLSSLSEPPALAGRHRRRQRGRLVWTEQQI